jgi:hypothetical protein
VVVAVVAVVAVGVLGALGVLGAVGAVEVVGAVGVVGALGVFGVVEVVEAVEAVRMVGAVGAVGVVGAVGALGVVVAAAAATAAAATAAAAVGAAAAAVAAAAAAAAVAAAAAAAAAVAAAAAAAEAAAAMNSVCNWEASCTCVFMCVYISTHFLTTSLDQRAFCSTFSLPSNCEFLIRELGCFVSIVFLHHCNSCFGSVQWVEALFSSKALPPYSTHKLGSLQKSLPALNQPSTSSDVRRMLKMFLALMYFVSLT